MDSRLAGVAVVLLAAVATAGAVAMWVDFRSRVDETAADTASAPRLTPSPEPTAEPTPEPTTPEPTPSASAADEVRSLWVGDGYTVTACDTATLLDWTCAVDAERGTGFLSDGTSYDPEFATLGDRLAGLPRAEPDVVVVDAGRNDLGVYATPALLEAMDDYLSRLRERYPHAALVQIVPWTSAEPTSDPAMTAAVEDLMAAYDGQAVAATGEPLVGRELAVRLRELGVGA